MIRAIVTADRNWAIGKNGSPITVIPDNERYIRSTTTGNTVIIGSRTISTYLIAQIPANRTNLVLSWNKDFKIPGAKIAVCNSVEDALKKAQESTGECYVLGGESIYRQFLPYCEEVEVTAVDYSYDADAHFPNLDKLPEWVLVEESEEMTHFDTVYHIKKYRRRTDYQN